MPSERSLSIAHASEIRRSRLKYGVAMVVVVLGMAGGILGARQSPQPGVLSSPKAAGIAAVASTIIELPSLNVIAPSVSNGPGDGAPPTSASGAGAERSRTVIRRTHAPQPKIRPAGSWPPPTPAAKPSKKVDDGF
jgi:hypothetical protein